MFIMWSIDDKVACSAAVVPKGLSLASFCLADICWGLDGFSSQPCLSPSENLGSGVRLLGFKAQRCHYGCVAFAKLLDSVSISCQMGLIYYLPHRVIVRRTRKHTQGIWNKDSPH